MTQWQLYSEKFSQTSKREQYLTIATGLVAIVFILYSLFLDAPLQRTAKLKQANIAILSKAINDNSTFNTAARASYDVKTLMSR